MILPPWPPIGIPIFGLFIANMTNISVPLTGVQYDVSVKSFAAHITINQTYKNVEKNDLECVYGFPINDKAAIVGLTVVIGNRTIVSQFKKKDEAFKEYTNALARNDGAYLLDQSDRSDDTFVLSVGRLPPGKEAVISISYVNTLDSITETKLRLTMPTALYPRYSPNPQAPKGVAPPEKYRGTVPYSAKLNARITGIDAIVNITSLTHEINVTNIGPKESTITFASDQQPLDRDLSIDIDLKTNPENYVEVENTAGSNYTAMYAFVPNIKQSNGSGGSNELIFVVDCSGSMEEEDKIGDAKKAMQVFLRSVPEGSYFNFYRFGSNYESLFNASQPYTADTFTKAKDYADSTSANLGGTEILRPLQNIYATPPRPGFNRQIFLMTDGEVDNTNDVIALVRDNAVNTRLFSFGLGKSPSRSLINGVADAGKGKPEFITHGQELGAVVARQLNRAIQPSITNASVTWYGVKNVQQVPAVLPVLFKGDRELIYAFFELDPSTDGKTYIELQRGGTKTKIPLDIPYADPKSTEKPFLDKLAARALIKQIENSAPATGGYRGSLQSRAPLVANDDIKQHVTDLSLTYGVLSRYVSLIAVENRTEDERKNATKTMELREVPIQKAEPPQPKPLPRPIWSPGPIWRHRPMFAFNGGGGGFHRAAAAQSASVMSFLDDDSGPAGMASQDSFSHARPASAPAPPPAGESPSAAGQLSELLGQQEFSGAWNFSPVLERLTNISQSDIVAAVSAVRGSLSDEVVSTIFVATYLEVKHPDQANVYATIIGKANAFLDKQNDADTVAKVKAALTALIQSK